jgi:hypothetical protein
MARHLSQRGQVLVLGSIFMAALALAAFRYFQVGQVLAQRVRQTHALDAATYSGALVQARVLNALSLLNRTHVAHQVAMAHLVTLGSWALFGGTQARQLAQGNPPAFLVGTLFGPEHGSAYLAARRASGFNMMAATGRELAQAFVAHDQTVRNQLVVAQNDLVATLAAERTHAMRHVLHRNFPATAPRNFDLSVHAPAIEPRLVLQSGQGGLRSAVEQAAGLYHFLDQRNQTKRNTWAVDPRCPWLRHQLRRRGQTSLGPDGRWQSTDTESFHALRSNRWIGCYYREYPMGWGWIPAAPTQPFDAEHAANPPDTFSSQDFWRWVRDATDWNLLAGDDNPLGNSRAVAARPTWYGGGLPAVFRLAQTSRHQPFEFASTLRHAVADQPVIATHSAAQSYFERPQARADGTPEAANVFNPYWQARLVRSRAVDFWQGGKP